jgi:hypothetical protein
MCVATIRRGDLFGEMALLALDAHRKATVTTLTYCDTLELIRADFDVVIARYPTFLDAIIVKREQNSVGHGGALSRASINSSIMVTFPMEELDVMSTHGALHGRRSTADDGTNIPIFPRQSRKSVASMNRSVLAPPASAVDERPETSPPIAVLESKPSPPQDDLSESDVLNILHPPQPKPILRKTASILNAHHEQPSSPRACVAVPPLVRAHRVSQPVPVTDRMNRMESQLEKILEIIKMPKGFNLNLKRGHRASAKR